MLNRLDTVTDLTAGTTRYQYDHLGNLQGVAYANNVTHDYTYDPLNRLTNLAVKRNSTLLQSYTYTLGAAGNRTGVVEASGRAVGYTYDCLYRLTSETISNDPYGTNGVVSYAFDGVGNRTGRTVTGALAGSLANQSFGYDANDRFNSGFNYDANGNTTGSAKGVDSYDYENRLISRNTGQIQVRYDGDGNRVRKSVTVNGVTTTTLFVVDDRNPTGYAQVLEELSTFNSQPSTFAVTRAYVYGHDLIAQDQIRNFSWTLSFYGYDGHGSVRLLTDIQGQVTDTYDYDAFGNQIAQGVFNPVSGQMEPVDENNATWITANVYLYTGEQFDPDLGFYYLRARYHHPETGRFWTMDSYEGRNNDPLTLHKYLYCSANPVNGVDPSGRFTLPGYPREVTLRIDYCGDGWGDYLTWANVWNAYEGSGNSDHIYVLVVPGDNIYTKVAEAIGNQKLKPGVDIIKEVYISGHGTPGDLGFDVPNAPESITLQSLRDPNSSQSMMLFYLRPYTVGVATVYLQSCDQATGADGKAMMQLMAQRLGAHVIGYEGRYPLTFRQWTAERDGSIRRTGIGSIPILIMPNFLSFGF